MTDGDVARTVRACRVWHRQCQRQDAGRKPVAPAVLAVLLMLAGSGTGTTAPVAHGGALAGFDLRYAMHYAGLQIASISLQVAPEPEATRSRLVIASEGLAALVGRNVTSMTASSRSGARPDRFSARFEKPDRTRDVAVRWNPAGQVTKAVEIRRGSERPSEVPDTERQGTVDPLTAVLRLRGWLAEPQNGVGSRIELAVFDGRKRLDLAARRLDDRRRDGQRQPRFEAKLVPRFGFDASDHYLSWPGQPERWFEVTASADGRFAPLAIAEAGQPVITVTHDCSESGCAPLSPP